MTKEKSIAVLPFSNISSDPDNEYFSDGITEEIINALSKIPGLRVTSRTSSFAFKGKNVELGEIARQLKVKMLVEGSVRKMGDEVRISVHLIDAEDDVQYWAETYDRKLENIFELQNQVAIEVAEKLRESTGHFEISDHLVDERAKSIEAYELLLRANHRMNDLSREGVEMGIKLMEQAIIMEPDNASFHATKSVYLAVFGLMGAMPIKRAYDAGISASKKSLEINPENPDANSSYAFLKFCYDGDLDAFFKHIFKALEVRPNDPAAHAFLSIVDAALNRYDDSMTNIQKLFDMDPLSQMPYYIKAVNLVRMRRYEEGLEAVNRLLDENPHHLNAYQTKGLIFLRTGKISEAIEHYKNMPLGPDQKYPYYTGMGIAYAIGGHLQEAEECLEKIESGGIPIHPVYHENGKVMINFLLGRFEEGFKHLQEDIENKAYYLKYYRNNPLFDSILSDPRASMLNDVLTGIPGSEEDKPKYAKSGLTDQELKNLEEKLNHALVQEKKFLDSDLSLKKLAEHVGTTANKLSQVINVTSKRNFFDLVNTYRIDELKKLLSEPSNKKYTILSLAYEAGFASKSTFNASFKKLTGQTPSEYVNAL